MRRALLLLLVMLSLLAGCGRTEALPYVRLHDLDPTLAAGSLGTTARHRLRVGVATMLSPSESLLHYGPVMEYLSSRLDRPVEMVLSRSQTEMVDLLHSGGVQIGLVGSYAYVRGEAEFGLVAVAAPVYQEDPSHRSLILVRRYSGLESFANLKGHTFAYTDPVSVTGRLYPETLILGLHESVERFFDRTLFTYSDIQSIRALDQGLVDGAAVNSTLFAQALTQDPDLERRLVVVAESPPLGVPPVVVNPRIGSDLRQALQQILVGMGEDEEGRAILAEIGVERFEIPEPAQYDSIREMANRVGVNPS